MGQGAAVVLSEEIRKQVRRPKPPDTSELRFSKPKEYAAGLTEVEPELRPLQEWAVKALASRNGLTEPLGEGALEKVQALMVLPAPQDNAWQLAAVLAEAHGFELVFEALLAPHTLGVRDGSEGKRRLVRTPADTPWKAVRWLNALTWYVDAAPEATRQRLQQLAEGRRPALPLELRAALTDLFREPAWAEADAQALLATKPKAHAVAYTLANLLPLVERDETFEALAALWSSYLGSSAYFEIARYAPADWAARRLLRLLREPLAKRDTTQCEYIVRVLAGFPQPEAAEAVAEAALLAKDEAKAYFKAQPQHRALLEQHGKGRGKRPREYQALLTEMDRQSAAGASVVSADVVLPKTLAAPPWLAPGAPWAARDVPLVVDGERVIASPELEAWLHETRGARSEAEVLAKAEKNLIDASELAALGDAAALAHIGRLNTFALPAALARFGLRALPALAAVLNRSPKKNHVDVLQHVRSPRFAAVAWSFHFAEDWLLSDPQLSAQGLIPELFAADVARRFIGELGLVRLCAAGFRAQVEAAATCYGALGKEVLEILDRDASQRLPDPLPTLAPVLSDGSLPVLVTEQGPLPASTIPTIGTLLGVSRLWARHPGLTELRKSCSQESRDAFAWELYQKTRNLDGVAHLGGDVCVRQLDAILSNSRTTMPPAQRFHAFKVLACVGTPLAIVQLRKYGWLSLYADRARIIERLLDELARVRGQSPGELEDSALSELDVARDLPLLDFGARRFSVTLDEHLLPTLRDEAGRVVDKLPKPIKKDDPEKVAATKLQLQTLQLDLDDVRQVVLLYFERAMTTARAWALPQFQRAILGHPLLWQVARRLVFSAGKQHFRVAEDKTFADYLDARVELAPDVSVSVAHPIQLSEPELLGFRQLFLDYEIIQPFPQLERSVFRLSAADVASLHTVKIEGGIERVLGTGGWRQAEDNIYEKPLAARTLRMTRSRRVSASSSEPDYTEFTDLKVIVTGDELSPATLNAIEASELLRDSKAG